jgi:hypothetical protein
VDHQYLDPEIEKNVGGLYTNVSHSDSFIRFLTLSIVIQHS